MTVLMAVLRNACGIFALFVLAFLLWSILRAAKRPAGAGVGTQLSWLHSPLFYAAASAVFFGLCVLLWIPLPALPAADAAAVLGALLCFPGLVFVLWGRLALGNMYFVSTGFGAQLFAGHRLITSGPYAIVRHPMYFGLLLAGIGGLLLYQTWTGVIFVACGLGVIRRALREEEVLSKEFGAEWMDYCRRVPMLLPRLFQ
ncbi:MAG: isoprenylcysteine carboxylmethyltransferase family protein [Anaerolineales bacterium]